jgi:hypothetical protein
VTVPAPPSTRTRAPLAELDARHLHPQAVVGRPAAPVIWARGENIDVFAPAREDHCICRSG